MRKLDDAWPSAYLFVYPYSAGGTSFGLTAYNFKQDYSATRYWWGAVYQVTCVSDGNACLVGWQRVF